MSMTITLDGKASTRTRWHDIIDYDVDENTLYIVSGEGRVHRVPITPDTRIHVSERITGRGQGTFEDDNQ